MQSWEFLPTQKATLKRLKGTALVPDVLPAAAFPSICIAADHRLTPGNVFKHLQSRFIMYFMVFYGLLYLVSGHLEVMRSGG